MQSSKTINIFNLSSLIVWNLNTIETFWNCQRDCSKMSISCRDFSKQRLHLLIDWITQYLILCISTQMQFNDVKNLFLQIWKQSIVLQLKWAILSIIVNWKNVSMCFLHTLLRLKNDVFLLKSRRCKKKIFRLLINVSIFSF